MLLTPSIRKDRARLIRNLSRHKTRRPRLAIETLEGRQMLAAQVVAFDMLGSADQNLVSFTNPFDGAFASAADGFQKYQRGVSPSIPFALLDDSLSIFPPDEFGIIKEGNTDEFFGVADTENPQNSGPVSAKWVFDISGATDLLLSIDMGAMGNFEGFNDFFEWSYSIDGGSTMTAFASSVDEAGSFTYTLDDGDDFTLDDPMLVQGTILSNELATYSTPIVGSGSELTLTLTAMSNGSDEGIAFQNIVIRKDLPVVAFDMVASADQNLTSFTNPFDGAFSSPGDGFQKYQRGVSPSIPFAVLDDSLSIFPADMLGIIGEGNTDEFFGVVDTQNPQNNGPVSATWVFDISGATDLLLSIDMGAMGDFETSDFFEWSYSVDGGPTMTAFSSSVDSAGSFTYTLEDGDSFLLNDPMLVQGTILSNELATYSAPIVGSGSELTLTLTAVTNGGSEAIAFQNIVLREAPSVVPVDFEVRQGKIGLNGLSNSKGKSNGVVPIVLFTTDSFDASTVDVSTVIWAGAGVYHSSLEDVDNDGDLDLVLHFRLKDTDLLAVFAGLANKNGGHKKQSFNVSTTLSGETTDGTQFLGTAPVDVFMSGRALRDLLDSVC